MNTATKPRRADGKFAPKRVVAGGLVWQAEVDGQPYGANIGFEIAVRLGVPEKPRPGQGAAAST